MNHIIHARRCAAVALCSLALIGLSALGGWGGPAARAAQATQQATAQPTIQPTVQITAQPTNPSAAPPAATEEVAAATSAAPAATEEVAALGTVSGKVTNGTAGASLPADLTLELHIIGSGGPDDFRKLTTTLSADGTFAFRDVEIRASKVYGVVTRYRERSFTSQFVPGNPANPALDLPITLYEVTSDPAVLSINGVFVQIAPAQNTVSIAQVVRFSNSSDKIFSTDQRIGENAFASVSLPIPAGAQFTGFPEGDQSYALSEDRRVVSDLAPVLPGNNHLVQMTYSLAYNPNGTTVEIPLNYTLNGPIQLFIHPPNFTLTGSIGGQPLIAGERQLLNGQPYATFIASVNQPGGGVLRFTISGAATPPAAAQGVTGGGGGLSRDLLVGLLIGGGLGLIVVGGLMLIRERARERAAGTSTAGTVGAAGSPAQQADAQAQIAALVAELARLEEEFNAGQLVQADYESRRGEIKARLARLMKR